MELGIWTHGLYLELHYIILGVIYSISGTPAKMFLSFSFYFGFQLRFIVSFSCLKLKFNWSADIETLRFACIVFKFRTFLSFSVLKLKNQIPRVNNACSWTQVVTWLLTVYCVHWRWEHFNEIFSYRNAVGYMYRIQIEIQFRVKIILLLSNVWYNSKTFSTPIFLNKILRLPDFFHCYGG